MNIKEAVESAKAGHKIKRYSWGAGFPYVIYLMKNDTLIKYIDPETFTFYEPNDFDLFAYDWIVL